MHYKLKPDVKREWLKALRSGKFKQGRSYLRAENKFCCLGVLCHLKNPEGWHTVSNQSPSPIYSFESTLGSNTSYLPHKTVMWAFDIPPGKGTMSEISDLSSGTYLKKRGEYCTLAKENDEGKSFEEIANLIEEYF